MGAVATHRQGIASLIQVEQTGHGSLGITSQLGELAIGQATRGALNLWPLHRKQGISEGAVIRTPAQGFPAHVFKQVEFCNFEDPIGVTATQITLR